MNSLATLYKEQDRYEEAEPLYVKAYVGLRRVLGEYNSALRKSVLKKTDYETTIKISNFNTTYISNLCVITPQIFLVDPKHVLTYLQGPILEGPPSELYMFLLVLYLASIFFQRTRIL